MDIFSPSLKNSPKGGAVLKLHFGGFGKCFEAVASLSDGFVLILCLIHCSGASAAAS